MLTPDQEKLKEAALAAETARGGNSAAFSQAIVGFHKASNPAAILAILAQLEQVQGFLLEWWDGKCPLWMTPQEHAAVAEVNCSTKKEQALGRLAAAIATGAPLPPPPEAA